jgi:hypothetical protein
VKVNLSKPVRCFETLLDPAMMNFLFDRDGQEIRRDVTRRLKPPASANAFLLTA